MALTQAQLAARDGKLTASFAPALMAGDNPRIYAEWLRLIGDPAWTPPDLSDNWPVYHGSIMEPHVIDWHQRMTGHALTRRGEVVTHPTKPHVCATLDCYREFDRCVLDCKCPGAWMKLDHILNYYQPQLIVQRACIGCDNAALLISHGGATPTEFALTIDPQYEATVWQRIDQFWQHVQDLRPPVAFPPLVPPEQWRSIDLDRDAAAHNWATDMIGHLIDWENSRDAAVANECAKDAIKTLLPDDVGRVNFGHTLITRARNRAVTIKRVRS